MAEQYNTFLTNSCWTSAINILKIMALWTVFAYKNFSYLKYSGHQVRQSVSELYS